MKYNTIIHSPINSVRTGEITLVLGFKSRQPSLWAKALWLDLICLQIPQLWWWFLKLNMASSDIWVSNTFLNCCTTCNFEFNYSTKYQLCSRFSTFIFINVLFLREHKKNYCAAKNSHKQFMITYFNILAFGLFCQILTSFYLSFNEYFTQYWPNYQNCLTERNYSE